MEKLLLIAKYIFIAAINIGWPIVVGFSLFLLTLGNQQPSYNNSFGQAVVTVLSINPTILVPLAVLLPSIVTFGIGIWKYYKTRSLKSSLFYLLLPLIPVIIYLENTQ